MKKIRICLILILLPLLLMNITSCKIEDYEDMKHVYYSEMLSQKEDEYYVYVYRYDCAVCDRIKADVIHYYKNYKKYDLPRLYVLNKGDTVNNQGINADSDDPVNFVWTYNYFDIKTPTSPYLIRVRKGQVIAAYDGKTSILERLKIVE